MPKNKVEEGFEALRVIATRATGMQELLVVKKARLLDADIPNR
jgi:hypothetical protein